MSQKDSQAGRFWALLWLNAGEANGHGRQAAKIPWEAAADWPDTGDVKDGPDKVEWGR